MPSADALSPAWGTPKARGGGLRGGSFIRPPVLAGPPAAKPWACRGDVSHVGILLDRSQMTLGQWEFHFPQLKLGGERKGRRGQHQRIRKKELLPAGSAGTERGGLAPRTGCEGSGGIGGAFVGQLGVDRKGRHCRRSYLNKAWSWEGSWYTPRPGRGVA